MKKTLLTILTLLLTVVIGAQVANAIGSLTPSGTAGDATQYTLNDIYTRLTSNNSTSTKSGMFTTPGSVTATFRTLTEIYSAIPTIDAAKVATGTSYLGVTGTLATSTPALQWSTNQGSLTWDNAVAACAGTVDGSTGWRLPTISELLSGISDDAIINPPSSLYGGGQYCWSSTSNSSNAWAANINFASIISSLEGAKTAQLRTYCVR